MFDQYQYQPAPPPVYRPPQQLAFLPPPVQPTAPQQPLSQSLEKSVGRVRRGEDEFSYWEFFTDASNIIPFMLFWALALFFYVSDLDSWRMNHEEAPDNGNLAESNGVLDDPSISDRYVPGGPLDGTTPGIWGSYTKENDDEDENKTIELDTVMGKIRYTAGSFDTQMIWDWISGVAYKRSPGSEPKEKIRNMYTSFKINRAEAVALLKDLGITKHGDLWELVVTPCSTTKKKLVNSKDCLQTRRNLQIIAWRFFSSDTPPPLYPVRPIRIAIINSEDRGFLKGEIDPVESDYSTKRYYIGATGPIEALSPFLLGTEIQ